MGFDPSIVHAENIARHMSAADRKRLGVQTADEAAAIAAAKSEKHLQQQLVGLLRRNDIVPFRQRMDRKSNIEEGLPDIMFSVGRPGLGFPVCWECKMIGKNPTRKQYEQHAALRANGWDVQVIRTYDEGLRHLADVQRAFREIEQQKEKL